MRSAKSLFIIGAGLIVIIHIIAGNPASIESSSAGLSTINERLLDDLLQPEVSEKQVMTLLNTIQPDGSWPDINYEDFSLTGFEHYRHQINIHELCRAFKKPGSPFYNQSDLLKAINKSVNFWLKHDFIASNWHTNEIAVPETWANILLIMKSDLSDRQSEEILLIAKRASINAWGARPGGDLVKIAGIMAKVAVYEEDSEMLEKAVRIISEEIRITSGKGIKPDLSFHHRVDRVTSVLSYGTGYANVFAGWAVKLTGTGFSFPDESIELVIDFFLDGICQTMVYGKYPDPGAMNRGISRPGALSKRSADLPERLLSVSSYRKKELETIIKIRDSKLQPGLTSNRFFWHSEYHSHQRPGFFTSVRMYSDRNRNMEFPHNQESIMQHHYADGSNFISVSGEEYFDIFPVLDWMKIPGATIVQKPEMPGPGSIVKRGLTDFAGGLSDGKYGIAAVDFSSPHDPLNAKKAWFMFDREIVCLGNSIESDSRYPVATTLNQSLLMDDITCYANSRFLVPNRGEHALKGVDWIYHDKIAYLFPGPTDIYLSNTTATGSWFNINRQSRSPRDPVSKDIFKLWLDHGSNPLTGKYEYIVLPGMAKEDIEGYRKNADIEILVNNPDIQAVKNKELNLSQIVFYRPGTISISGDLSISSGQAGLVMLKTSGKQITTITVADPTRKLAMMHIKVTARLEGSGSNWKSTWNKNGKYSDVYIALPNGEQAGSSAVIHISQGDFKEAHFEVPAQKENNNGFRDAGQQEQKHYVGQEYGGGIVFYLDDTGEHGLIAAKTDQSAGIRWKNGPSSVTHHHGIARDRVTNAMGDGLGAGMMNTWLIISQLTEDNPFNDFAGKLCADFQYDGFGDWYLPSKYELDLVYQQKDAIGNFNGDLYWSSTEHNVGFSWGQSFHSYGGQYAYNKNIMSNVRCIRRF